jgi:hypothetical protein
MESPSLHSVENFVFKPIKLFDSILMIVPVQEIARSCGLSTGMHPNALDACPMIGLLIDLAAAINFTYRLIDAIRT